MKAPIIAALLVLMLSSMPLRAQTTSFGDIRIGARADARPFVWKEARSGAMPVEGRETGEFLGFFWDICTEAVARAGYDYGGSVEEVDSEKRQAFLQSGEGGYDLLCDPTTITLSRMAGFAPGAPAAALEFSPIIFVANGTFVQQERGASAPFASGKLPIGKAEAAEVAVELTARGVDAPPQQDGAAAPLEMCRHVRAWLDTSTGSAPSEEFPWPPSDSAEQPVDESPSEDEAPSGEEAEAADAGGTKTRWPGLETVRTWFKSFVEEAMLVRPPATKTDDLHFRVWGYVAGSTIGAELERDFRPGGTTRQAESDVNLITCLTPFASHAEAAEAFCQGRLAQYFGDAEIVKAALRTYREASGEACAADLNPTRQGTYEPYAFVLSRARYPDFPERFVLALYGMFEDETVERLFRGHFPDVEASDYLQTLFRINRIPRGSGAGAGEP